MTKHDFSMSNLTINLGSLVIALPLFMMLMFIFMAIWGDDRLGYSLILFAQYPILFFGVLIGGYLLHQVIHGLTWQWLSGDADTVKYVIRWKSLAISAEITKTMDIFPFVMGLIMPGLVLGVLPMMMSFIDGSGALLLISLIFVLAASDDWFMLWKLRNVESDAIVENHPTRTGVFVYQPTHPSTIHNQ